jgi:hypothetical protein
MQVQQYACTVCMDLRAGLGEVRVRTGGCVHLRPTQCLLCRTPIQDTRVA